ncbi:hypothetical protein D3C74_426490 [compost metagenome]
MKALSFNGYRHSNSIITCRRIEQADKAADNQIIELPLLCAEQIQQYCLFGWNNRMMIAYLAVVHDPFRYRQRLTQQRSR